MQFDPAVNDLPPTCRRPLMLASFKDALDRACAEIGVALNGEQCDKLESHYRLMIEANRRFNLTRITDPVEAAVKHYADALSVVGWSRDCAVDMSTVLDVGTGPGLPALALAVARPDWQVTAIDSNAKKAGFVADCAKTLQLPNLIAVQKHTHHWRDCPDRFDLITFRAVGKLADCIAQAVPFLTPAGSAVCYKSQQMPESEFIEGQAAARRTDLRIQAAWPYALTLGTSRLQHQLLALRVT